MKKTIHNPTREIEYRGYYITRQMEIINASGESCAQCDSLYDARETIDEMLSAS